MAAYLTARGHSIGVWSQKFSQHRTASDGAIAFQTTGMIEDNFSIQTINSLSDLKHYGIVVVALPATAYSDVLPKLAQHLTAAQSVIFSGSLSLAPLWLRELAQANGQSPTVIAWGTTLLAAHFQSPSSLHIPFVRKQFDIAAIPAHQTAPAVALCTELFGIEFGAAASALDVGLSNINPIAHAGQMIVNFSRIDRQENWLLFEHFTQSGINIAESLDAERLRVAAAFGARSRSLRQHYALSYNVPDSSVAAMVDNISSKGSRTRGPRALDHRYLVEDMPYGLVFLERLARCGNIDTPLISAAISLLEAMTGQRLREGNKIIDRVIGAGDDTARIVGRCLSS